VTVKSGTLLGMALIVALIALPALAHHGTSAFDMTRAATIKGTVIEYRLINPHVQMTIRVTGSDGASTDWTVEAVSLNMMVRAGFKPDSLKAGDVVSVSGHPGKNGKTVMLLMKIQLADGQELSAPYE
jgi:hypothetical protein